LQSTALANAFVESFNGKFRDECLNEHWFASVAEARTLIEAWRGDYNTVRPHSALQGATPEQFANSDGGRRRRRRRLALTGKTKTRSTKTLQNPRTSHYPCSG